MVDHPPAPRSPWQQMTELLIPNRLHTQSSISLSGLVLSDVISCGRISLCNVVLSYLHLLLWCNTFRVNSRETEKWFCFSKFSPVWLKWSRLFCFAQTGRHDICYFHASVSACTRLVKWIYGLDVWKPNYATKVQHVWCWKWFLKNVLRRHHRGFLLRLLSERPVLLFYCFLALGFLQNDACCAG